MLGHLHIFLFSALLNLKERATQFMLSCISVVSDTISYTHLPACVQKCLLNLFGFELDYV